MTYCLAIKLKTGFIGIADTRITSGHETTTAKKVFVENKSNHTFFIMTSGLRSVRDKAMTYFKETIEEEDQNFNKMYKVANAFAQQIKRVALEDKQALSSAGLNFNLYSIVGGQLQDDDEHKVFLLYPEGNWVEISEGTPFVIIGNSGYGKPILNRVMKHESSLKFALKAGILSFDATRISANDVDFPIDVIYYEKDSFNIIEKRYKKDELSKVTKLWNKNLSENIANMPDTWMDKILE